MTDFEIRSIRPEEGDAIVNIEHTCFPPGVAETREALLKRVALAPELFTVAVEKGSGKLVAYLNGVSTDREHFSDDFFTDFSLYVWKARWACIRGCISSTSVWRIPLGVDNPGMKWFANYRSICLAGKRIMHRSNDSK